MTTSERNLLWLRRLRDLSRALAAETDVKALLSLIVDAAIELTDAERGFLVRFERGDGKPRIKVSVARGFDKTWLQGGAGKVSRTVVQRVLEQDRAVVTSQEEDQDIRDITSIRQRRVRSVACVPMRLRGRVLGAIYLDHRFDREAFTEDDVPCLEAFADQAALALETADLLADQARRQEKLGAALRELEALKSIAPSATSSLPDPKLLPRFGALIGGSGPMQGVYTQVERAARSHAPVLILGESGTGKELVAREVHLRGEHATQPFLSDNCAAIPAGLLESELFGHTKGAFTGAERERRGLLAEAGRGTLFLDEVGDMPLPLQGKLLRVLQERRFRPVGGEALLPLECRVIAATHRDLSDLVRAGQFREDLFYRLDVLRISVPPLRARKEDLTTLLSFFLDREGAGGVEVTADLLEAMRAYPWPGNVRELENEACRLAVLGSQRLSAADLSRGVVPSLEAKDGYAGKTLAEVEREMILAALEESGGNRTMTAKRLGIARSSLYGLLKRYDIS